MKEQEVKTLVDVAILDRRFEMSKKKKYNGTGKKYSNRKEIVPDWLYKDDESTNLEEERKLYSLLMKSVRDYKKC